MTQNIDCWCCMGINYCDKDLEKAISIFINKEKRGYETRYRSWQKCHKHFLKNCL